MKDFYDLWVLSRDFDFDGALLARSIVATFTRRKTLVPVELPPALSEEFGTDSDKLVQWDGFRKRGQLRESDVELVFVVDEVRRFAMPCFEAIRASRSSPGSWTAGGAWSPG